MSDKMNNTVALAEIRKASNMFRAFAHVEEVLTVVAGLEQNERELTDAIKARKQELFTLQASVAEQTDAVAKAKAKAGEILKNSQLEADRVTREANDYANSTRIKSKADGETIVAALEVKIRDRRKELANIGTSITQNNEILSDLNFRISKARASAAEIVKGG